MLEKKQFNQHERITNSTIDHSANNINNMNEESLIKIEPQIEETRCSRNLKNGSMKKILKSDDELVSMYDVFSNILPNLLTSSALLICPLVEIHFIGSYGDIAILDGVGLGHFFKVLVFYLLVISLTDAIPIICSKSFGNRNFKLLGEQVNQIRIITHSVFFVFGLMFFLWPRKILLILGGDKNENYLAISETYIKCAFTGLFFELNYSILTKFAATHLEFKAINYSTIFSLVCHPVICYILIKIFDLKEIGAGWASSITSFFKLGFLYLYIQFDFKYPQSNFFCTVDTFNWTVFKETLVTSIYSAIISFAEASNVFFGVLLCTRLSELSYAKYVIIANIGDFNFIIEYTFMATATNLIGNFIGRNSPKNMQRVIYILFIVGFAAQILVMLLYMIFHKHLAYFFSTNPEVYLHMRGLLIFNAAMFAIHFIMAYVTGILRVCDKLEITIIVSVVGLMIAEPISAYILAFSLKLDLWGVCLGENLAIAGVVITLIIFYMRLDFQKVCEEFNRINEIETGALEHINQNNSGEESSLLLKEQEIAK